MQKYKHEERKWWDKLDERQKKELVFAECYARDFNHGTVGHNRLILLSRLAELLDEAYSHVEV